MTVGVQVPPLAPDHDMATGDDSVVLARLVTTKRVRTDRKSVV